jgi:hypothetical protein
VTLRDLRVGTHRLNLEIGDTSVTVEHAGGPQAILIAFRPASAPVATLDDTATMDIRGDSITADGTATATLRVGTTATIAVQNGVAQVQHLD